MNFKQTKPLVERTNSRKTRETRVSHGGAAVRNLGAGAPRFLSVLPGSFLWSPVGAGAPTGGLTIDFVRFEVHFCRCVRVLRRDSILVSLLITKVTVVLTSQCNTPKFNGGIINNYQYGTLYVSPK